MANAYILPKLYSRIPNFNLIIHHAKYFPFIETATNTSRKVKNGVVKKFDMSWTGAVVGLQHEPSPDGRASLPPEELPDPPGDDRRHVLRDARRPGAARHDVRPLRGTLLLQHHHRPDGVERQR